MRRTLAATLLLVLILAGCGTPTTTTPPAPVVAAASTSVTQPSTSAVTSQQQASIRADAGIPADPDPATRAAYIKDLDAIDRDIVHGKSDKAVRRGLNQCSSMKEIKDRQKLIQLTDQRFSSPDHPDGHGAATAAKILDVVHERLCPTY